MYLILIVDVDIEQNVMRLREQYAYPVRAKV